jgi:uncharacterized metal-binding protein YceD (DUF177 family)
VTHLPSPEFSRGYRLDAIGADDRAVAIQATAKERADLARRFGLLTLDQLAANATFHHTSHGIDARGKMRTSGSQACVVTGEPIAFDLNENFIIRFVAADQPDAEEELELTEADLDVVEHDGNIIDLGEAVAQTMGLALDPFPRGPNAAAKLKEAGVIDESEVGPFSALSALKDMMSKG